MKKFIVTGIFLFLSSFCRAQQDSTNYLEEIVVTGFHTSGTKATSLNLESYSLEKLEKNAPLNLSDAIAKLPGISQMTTGNAISKPAIRGLFGNRILVLVSGLRFDNQQFQDEHGLGLSQIGISSVEIIKGPASLLYGTDANGGVINIIEEVPVQQGQTVDIHTRLYSNTAGTLTDIGFASRKNNKWFRIRGGYENHADYTDGNNQRVLNSRNTGYYFKAGWGFEKAKWIQNNSYNFSYNQYGFILDSMTKLYVDDGRYSRQMEGPHHNVLLNYISSQNTFVLHNSLLKLNLGLQSNKREEDEGSGKISLNMHLFSALQNLKWEKQLSDKLLFVLNQQFTFEDNTNLGRRILIPDANMFEGNMSAYLQWHISKVNIEAGAGYNYKQVVTYKTKSLNSGDTNTPDTSILPFSKGKHSYNAMIGISYNPAYWCNIKSNISTGNRAPNLAELSSNGLHEGTYRVEIGDPELDMERNINSDLTIEIQKSNIFFQASAFYNHFFNYIYLDRSNEPTWLGFDKYRYVQQNANLFGGELVFAANIGEHFRLKETYSQIQGTLTSGKNLPFIPANRSVSSVKYVLERQRYMLYLEPELEHYFAQHRPAQFETATPAYDLININSGFTVNKLQVNLSCKNLLNKTYFNHLSRLKYYGMYNQGINFVLSVNAYFGY